MPEFKVNTALLEEITSFKEAGEKINSDISSVSEEDVSTLKTGSRYVSEHNTIMELMNLYKSLIKKDASDLNAMVKSAQTMDDDIADGIQ